MLAILSDLYCSFLAQGVCATHKLRASANKIELLMRIFKQMFIEKILIYIEYINIFIIVNENDMHIYNTLSIISQQIFYQSY